MKVYLNVYLLNWVVMWKQMYHLLLNSKFSCVCPHLIITSLWRNNSGVYLENKLCCSPRVCVSVSVSEKHILLSVSSIFQGKDCGYAVFQHIYLCRLLLDEWITLRACPHSKEEWHLMWDYCVGEWVNNPFIILFPVWSCKEQDLSFQHGKDMIYLRRETCCVITACMLDVPWCVFRKALASLFVWHAKFSSADAPILRHLSVCTLARPGFLFECFRGTSHPHPPVKSLWNYLWMPDTSLVSANPFTKPCILTYGNEFHVLSLPSLVYYY